MTRYNTAVFKGITGGIRTIGYLRATATVTTRGKLTAFSVGCSEAPTDATHVIQLQRGTVAGTATNTRTPQPADPLNQASILAADDTHTVDPTLSANAFHENFGLNKRNTFRWVAPPGSELWIPAANGSGIALCLETGHADNFRGSMSHDE